MCDCDILRPDVFDKILRQARKDHECSECPVPIKKGDFYYDIRGLWDGSWQNHKICQDCYDLANYLQKKEDDFCWGLGDLFEEISNGYYFEDIDKILSCHYDGENLIKIEAIPEDSPEYDEDKHNPFYADVYRLIPF